MHGAISSERIAEKVASAVYKIELETRARREYRDLPARAREQIADAIDDLQKNPRPPGIKKLVGATGYRIRTGNYRILYTIDDSTFLVRIYRIGHRREVYR
jgi:mRNA interferase RelE/StbE